MKFLLEDINPFDPKIAQKDLELKPVDEFEEWCQLNPEECIKVVGYDIDINDIKLKEFFDKRVWKNRKGWEVKSGVIELERWERSINQIPIPFYKTRDFSIISQAKMVNLYNSPYIVEGEFYLNSIEIKTLKFAPIKAHSVILIYVYGLETLEYIPYSSYYHISNCEKIKSLKGLPNKVDTLVLENLPQLSSLKYIPKYIKEHLVISRTNIDSLKELDYVGGSIKLVGNKKLKSLEGLPKILNLSSLNGLMLYYIPKDFTFKKGPQIINANVIIGTNYAISLEDFPQINGDLRIHSKESKNYFLKNMKFLENKVSGSLTFY